MGVLAATALALKPGQKTADASISAPAEPTHADLRQVPTPTVTTLDLASAIGSGELRAEFKANGRERLRGEFTNTGAGIGRLRVPAGQLFENAANTVVALRASEIELAPNQTRVEDFQTAAAASSNKVEIASYKPVGGDIPALSKLIAHVEAHPEISVGTIQTAILAIQENLPVTAFAKFSQRGSDVPSPFATADFKAETSDIVGALAVLREIGIPDQQLALTIDPQLKIEAMIDPLAHAAAMRYYGITGQQEWDFWKNELLTGEASTRHYALFGIARFFPEVALQMLPSWARETRTSSVYRISAVQALAETQRPEALSVLRQLSLELGRQTELGRTAQTAAEFLDTRLRKSADSKRPVEFRASKTLPTQQQAAVSSPVAAIAAN